MTPPITSKHLEFFNTEFNTNLNFFNKDQLYNIMKENTLNSYGRTIEQVYYFFKIEYVHELLSTKEQDLINYFKKEIRKHFYYKKQVVCNL